MKLYQFLTTWTRSWPKIGKVGRWGPIFVPRGVTGDPPATESGDLATAMATGDPSSLAKIHESGEGDPGRLSDGWTRWRNIIRVVMAIL